jgi:hypothetical protein
MGSIQWSLCSIENSKWADVEFLCRVQTQAFELVMYEFCHSVAQARRAPEGRLISCRSIFALYNEYLTQLKQSMEH